MASTHTEPAAEVDSSTKSMPQSLASKKGSPHHSNEHDYVMVDGDANSSREQSACPTPIGLHPRGELPPKALKLMLPSPESHTSPRLHFGSMDAKSIAALEAAFGQDFVSDHLGEKANKDGAAKDAADADGADSITAKCEELDTPEMSPKVTKTATATSTPTLQERLWEAQREIARLQTALEDANQQQEWALASVVKANEAEKEELVKALQEMTEARNSLEQELKHNEKEFASLVTEELEQRFARFENTTLAAVSKIGGGAGDSSSASSAAFAPYCSPLGPAIISSPAGLTVVHAAPGLKKNGNADGSTVIQCKDEAANSSRLLVADLGAAGHDVSLMKALRSDEAQKAVLALEQARIRGRDKVLEISLQVHEKTVKLEEHTSGPMKMMCSAVGSRLRCIGGVFGAGRGGICCVGKNVIHAVQRTPSAINASGAVLGRAINQTAADVNRAWERSAAALGHHVQIGAAHVAGVTRGGTDWVQRKFTARSVGKAVHEVSEMVCKPFVIFGRSSRDLCNFLHRKDVQEVLAMYWVFALVGGCIWVCHVALQDPYENFISRSSHARQLSQLERRLIAASNARVKELEAEAAQKLQDTREKLERAQRKAVQAEKRALATDGAAGRRLLEDAAKEASAALDCLESRAADAAAAVAAAAGRIESSVREGADDIWKMEPEELFSWSGFPDIDLKNIVDKVCGRKD